jgi:hypothetical protein
VSWILDRGPYRRGHKYPNIRTVVYERPVNICIVMEFSTPTSAARSKRSKRRMGRAVSLKMWSRSAE